MADYQKDSVTYTLNWSVYTKEKYWFSKRAWFPSIRELRVALGEVLKTYRGEYTFHYSITEEKVVLKGRNEFVERP